MTKLKFLLLLNEKLSCLSQEDREERLSFYSEMIEDRMEEGLSEKEAVAAVGTVDEIAAQIVSEVPLTKLVKEKITPQRKKKAWEIVLLVLGSPIWLSLLIAAVAVVLALYIAFWSVIVSLWAVFGSVIGSAFGFVTCGVVFVCVGNIFSGVALLGAGLVCAGLSILLFFGCKVATQGAVLLGKKIVVSIKNSFIKKEAAQ